MSKNVWKPVRFFLCVAFGIFASSVSFGESFGYSSCRFAGEATAVLKAQILLDRALLDPKVSDHVHLREGISRQLLYYAGFLYHNEPYKNARVRISIAPEFEIDRLEISPGSIYPNTLRLTSRSGAFFSNASPYVAAAIRRGHTQFGEPALGAGYAIRIHFSFCADSEVPFFELQSEVPLDPYLAYWQVPEDQWRPLNWHRRFGVVNPCAENEITDVPDPEYFWYFWKPARSGSDDAGRTFHCETWYGNGAGAQRVTAHLVSIVMPDGRALDAVGKMLSEKSQINATAVFGVTDPMAESLSFPPGDSNFTGGLKEFQILVNDIGRKFSNAPAEDRDLGSRTYLEFLQAIPKIFGDFSFVLKTEGRTRIFRFLGKLSESDKLFRLVASFGPTDVFAPTGAKHWELLLRGLASDDIVIYSGHSGLGLNASLAGIAKATSRKLSRVVDQIKNKTNYQLVAYLSCYAYSYFGRDLQIARRSDRAKNFSFDLVRSGSSDTSSEMAIGIIKLVDDLISPNRFAGRARLIDQHLAGTPFLLIHGGTLRAATIERAALKSLIAK